MYHKIIIALFLCVAVYYDVENVKDPVSIVMNLTDSNLFRMWEIKVGATCSDVSPQSALFIMSLHRMAAVMECPSTRRTSV